ncbi:MAG: SDR family NAD(P)-dependent oxidoreductase [Gammaproteobacteria bacterium]|nr:SDR family NAD(P)-dependent oxidoreductase [Gammaproteobacteria bacterium]MBT8150770.1 SDR family NAD(P)-dependent oxidoreductase [Gammaproteobacteria bacterium]NND38942.1 SDR family NAD(P)-dependent oxidoreductase [Pseudomonadales bacterium]NNM11945.1 SDR family NAD(P)-dependent oxidoreductase [Pseudomonadales bacterium]
MANANSKRVALVSGASRGAGKGIALALGASGDTVYVTGRTENEGDAPLPGTVHATAEEISQRGGLGIAVVCDHADDAQVASLLARIQEEQGQLDILVNNVADIHDDLIKPGGFWTKSIGLANILDVGLRSAYVASYYAAAIMVAQKRGLIVNTGSFGARCYMHGPAYGAQKAGLDKMAWDMAHDLKPHNVAVISLWMGMLKTERTAVAVAEAPDQYAGFIEMAESAEFPGRVIDALFNSGNMMQKSGQTIIGAELAVELGIRDIDGKQPPSHRDMLGEPVQFSGAVVE